ncbi:MAG: energy-coupling factor ABC transporter ATP-binding protein [candidate division KSB1 bacterium]|nr:energy-coupling factor ABC transporter ATP-binding protein [candidate division KSB1 bacterium]
MDESTKRRPVDEPILCIEHVRFRYTGIAASPEDVLDDVSFSLYENECVAIVGPSGSGKSTLVQHFTGLLKPDHGQVLYRGQNIWGRGFDRVALRRRVGLVFQFPELQLFEETVEKDVGFAPKNFGLMPKEVEQRVVEALSAMDLDAEQFRSRSPFQLSEGEKRRVAIAGVLAMQPEMIVFDEPTAGLDPEGVRGFIRLVKRLQDQGKTIVVITHNMDFVAETADRVIVLFKGKILFDGTPRALFVEQTILQKADLELPSLRQVLAEYKNLPEEILDVLTMEQLETKLVSLSSHAA